MIIAPVTNLACLPNYWISPSAAGILRLGLGLVLLIAKVKMLGTVLRQNKQKKVKERKLRRLIRKRITACKNYFNYFRKRNTGN